MATALKAARGTKRTCQNTECGSRFYDLGRQRIVCPVCDTAYVLAVVAPSAAAVAAAAAAEKARKAAAAKKPEFEMSDDAKADAPEGEDAALAEIETTDEPVAVEDDETFLEQEEEDGGNVTNIIGGGAEAGPDEET